MVESEGCEGVYLQHTSLTSSLYDFTCFRWSFGHVISASPLVCKTLRGTITWNDGPSLPKGTVISFKYEKESDGKIESPILWQIRKDMKWATNRYQLMIPTMKGGSLPRCRGCSKQLSPSEPRIVVM